MSVSCRTSNGRPRDTETFSGFDHIGSCNRLVLLYGIYGSRGKQAVVPQAAVDSKRSVTEQNIFTRGSVDV